ncbi:MAG: hypothetical protein ACK5AN_25855, partial [Planctomyces sp.]
MRNLISIMIAVCYLAPSAVADDKSKSNEGPLAVEVADNFALQDAYRTFFRSPPLDFRIQIKSFKE